MPEVERKILYEDKEVKVEEVAVIHEVKEAPGPLKTQKDTKKKLSRLSGSQKEERR